MLTSPRLEIGSEPTTTGLPAHETAEAPTGSGHKIVGEKKHPVHTRLAWVDLVRAFALLWIFTNHVTERLFGYPLIANPSVDWPSLAERLAQLRPLVGYGIWNIPINLLRYAGWFGDQGVQLFLIVSGFGLTWGLLSRTGDAPLPVGKFYRRRAGRIYPLWWGVHLLFIASWLLVGWGLSPTAPATYLSMAGIRITPDLFYYFSPAWWYIGLLIQLYLAFPFLWEGLRRWGPLRLLVVSCAVAFAARAIGLLSFGVYVDAWQRGAIFINRLPEFVLGISLAAWLHRDPEKTAVRLRSPATVLLALAAYVVGIALSLTLLGMIVAPFLLGMGAFALLYAAVAPLDRLAKRATAAGEWLGEHSYSLYLLHHPLILLLVPIGLAGSTRRTLLGVVTAAALTLIGAVALEWTVNGAIRLLGQWRREAGIIRTILRLGVLAVFAAGLLIGAELLVRQIAPQEVLGWGERPSLQPDPTLGWRLKPSQEIRLRWESYDYRVSSNSLGFPGPEYPVEKGSHTFRILTTGDAFTSAEGVDTAQAWPRLLEAELGAVAPGRKVEVLNFAITGYGPNQYATIIKEYAPTYRPDLIIVGFYVNEYQDVLWSAEEFRQSIGFGLPAQDGLYSIIRLSHLQQWIRLQVREPMVELLRGKPRPHGYFLGGFQALERGEAESDKMGIRLVTERLQEIKEVADTIGARVILLMIPAPAQVCGPDRLAYYPRHVDLTDAGRFDLEKPQRLTREIAGSLGLGYYDLRPALGSQGNACPYQPRNMHWTATGHRLVADYLAGALAADGYLQETRPQ
jgi:peptidoglycan/LPS O-acetylase OafA/YrhL